MSKIVINELEVEICKALGIGYENTRRVTIDIEAGNIATINIENFMTNEQGQRLKETLWQKFELKLKEKKEVPGG